MANKRIDELTATTISGTDVLPFSYPSAGPAYKATAIEVTQAGMSAEVKTSKTITAALTTGAQTINKPAGSVNFAAAATSLVVTNSLVTTNSVILATVATNDTTMKTVLAVAASGSFTLHANAAATAETRVNFLVIN